MRLHVNFELATEINHVGKLALVGTSEQWNIERNEDDTIVTFLLVYTSDAPLVNFCPQGGFDGPHTKLLHSIFAEKGLHWMESPTDENQHFLIFTREVPGKLRDKRKFLRATAQKMYRELQFVEHNELWMQEQDDAYDYANAHYGCKHPSPDFTRERHNDAQWCKSEFIDLAEKAFDRMEKIRPTVVVPVYTHRKQLVEQVIQGGTPDAELSDIIAYTSNASLPEEHREVILMGWLTGYKSAPKLN